MNFSRLSKPITPRTIDYISNHRRWIAIFVPCLLAVVFLVSSFVPLGAAGQTGERKRVVEEMAYPNAPVQIVSITNKRHHIKFKEPILDDDDWLKGLEVEVINKSGKTVTHVGIDLLFERPADQANEPPTYWPLYYGLNPFFLTPEEHKRANSKIRPIRTGEKFTIPLSDMAYEDMKVLLRDTRYIDGIEKVRIVVTSIGFDDGTAWGGSFYIRDPKGPDGWSPKEKPSGSTKKSAAFPFLNRHHASNLAWLKTPLFEESECGTAITSATLCIEEMALTLPVWKVA